MQHPIKAPSRLNVRFDVWLVAHARRNSAGVETNAFCATWGAAHVWKELGKRGSSDPVGGLLG